MSLEDIEDLELVGIFKSNWSLRTMRLYRDPYSEDHVMVVGRTFDGSKVILSRERLSESMNFRIAVDYWRHGQKVYERD